MTTQLSVAARNAVLDAIETTIGTTPVLKIRTGDKPASCAAADAGTVLATFNLPSDWMAGASAGAKSKSGTWQDTSADGNGYAGHYRIYAADGATCHYQGLVSQAWQASVAYALGQQVNNGGNVYKATTAGTSASSGGPSGTGTGISDGTVVWAYVGAADLVMNNTNIAVNQPVSIDTYTWTAAGA